MQSSPKSAFSQRLVPEPAQYFKLPRASFKNPLRRADAFAPRVGSGPDRHGSGDVKIMFAVKPLCDDRCIAADEFLVRKAERVAGGDAITGAFYFYVCLVYLRRHGHINKPVLLLLIQVIVKIGVLRECEGHFKKRIGVASLYKMAGPGLPAVTLGPLVVGGLAYGFAGIKINRICKINVGVATQLRVSPGGLPEVIFFFSLILVGKKTMIDKNPVDILFFLQDRLL